MEKVTPFLMFQDGQAEEAMNFYTSIMEDAHITDIVRYNEGESGDEGTVMQALFTIKDQEFMCIDSNVKHDFTFTPAFSIYLTCSTEDELDMLFEQFSKDGQVLMPLGDYGFSQKFGWVNDRFGVSWQLTLL